MNFLAITPFRFIRGMGLAGARNPAIYLLICDRSVALAVEANLLAEAAVQLGITIHNDTASQLLHNSLPAWQDGSTRLIYFDEWLPELIEALDKHSALVVQDGGRLLLLTDKKYAERILSTAPNLRSRLTEVFQISPDDLSGGLSV